MRLPEYARQILRAANSQNVWAADFDKANDSLIRPFERMEAQKKAAEELKPVAVYDQAAASKLEELQKKIQHNEAVASRLESVCSELGMTNDFSLRELYQRKSELIEDSRWTDVYHSQDIQPYREAASRMGLEFGTVLQHPKVAELTAQRDAKIAANDKETIELKQKIDAIESVLRDFKW